MNYDYKYLLFVVQAKTQKWKRNVVSIMNASEKPGANLEAPQMPIKPIVTVCHLAMKLCTIMTETLQINFGTKSKLYLKILTDWIYLYWIALCRFSLENEGINTFVAIYLNKTSITVFNRMALFSIFDFLANFGGLLSLFLGISVLSIVNLVLHQIKKVQKWQLSTNQRIAAVTDSVVIEIIAEGTTSNKRL